MQACAACIRFGDMGGVVIDIASAMVLAQANGVAAPVAGSLIAACAEGVMYGVNDRRGEGEK